MGGRQRRRGLALMALAAAAHLGCVILGALHVDLQRAGRLGWGVAYHGALSGADSGYGFFAPSVGALPWARFQVTDARGKVIDDVLASGANPEVDLRVRSIVSSFMTEEDESMRRALAASWAGKVLARYPGAASVVVRLEICDLPSMQEYRDGKRPAWNLIYEAKVVRQHRPPAAPQENGGAP
ncbi:hypothetical protein [Sorangium sp. So ce1078]|uniref:hypothetical protein n=1 Tax=Sorangium sp. So ce1078 TaxID=3133329 RepID=UPI003F61F687